MSCDENGLVWPSARWSATLIALLLASLTGKSMVLSAGVENCVIGLLSMPAIGTCSGTRIHASVNAFKAPNAISSLLPSFLSRKSVLPAACQ
ncbi:MAG: hypothetical protein OQK77_01130 [Psychromonas sp.]|nr:hypothetical protein [Psychromonas sp.]